MHKTWLLCMLVAIALPARSQDTKSALIQLNNYAITIDKLLHNVYVGIKTYRYADVVHEAVNVRANLELMETKLDYLPDAYYYPVSSMINDYKMDVRQIEKIGSARDFNGKNKMVGNLYNGLLQRQKKLRQQFDLDYADLMQKRQNEQQATAAISVDNPFFKKEPDPVESTTDNNEADSDAASQLPEAPSIEVQAPELAQQQAQDTTLAADGPGTTVPEKTEEGNTIVVVDAGASEDQDAKTYRVTSSGNPVLVERIKDLEDQIGKWIDSIHIAMQVKEFTKVGAYAKNISNTSLKISDLTLLLKSDQKESLYILATGLRNLAISLEQLSFKGNRTRDEMHDNIDQVEIKYSSLSTGIELI